MIMEIYVSLQIICHTPEASKSYSAQRMSRVYLQSKDFLLLTPLVRLLYDEICLIITPNKQALVGELKNNLDKEFHADVDSLYEDYYKV